MIFGIGLARTGTHSLTEALCMMGLNAVHWDNLNAHVMDHWYEPDLTLPDDLDAFISGPFVRWWRAADRLYPNSRFILTTRDKNAWLESAERRLSRSAAMGDEWFNRRLLYWGIRRFHRELFSAMWDEHHESVMRYFEGRDDLLVIDIAGTPGPELWESLSRFVGRPAPNAPFPHLNRSKK